MTKNRGYKFSSDPASDLATDDIESISVVKERTADKLNNYISGDIPESYAAIIQSTNKKTGENLLLYVNDSNIEGLAFTIDNVLREYNKQTDRFVPIKFSYDARMIDSKDLIMFLEQMSDSEQSKFERKLFELLQEKNIKKS